MYSIDHILLRLCTHSLYSSEMPSNSLNPRRTLSTVRWISQRPRKVRWFSDVAQLNTCILRSLPKDSVQMESDRIIQMLFTTQKELDSSPRQNSTNDFITSKLPSSYRSKAGMHIGVIFSGIAERLYRSLQENQPSNEGEGKHCPQARFIPTKACMTDLDDLEWTTRKKTLEKTAKGIWRKWYEERINSPRAGTIFLFCESNSEAEVSLSR